MNKSWLDAVGGRKFVLTIIVIIVGTVVQLFSPGGCNPSYASLLIGLCAAFNTANSVVTAIALKGQQDESKP